MDKKHSTDKPEEGSTAKVELEAKAKKPRLTSQPGVSNRVLLKSLGQIQSQFIIDSDPRASFAQLLSVLLKVTKSEYGFIGEVLYSEKGEPFMKAYAITNIAWNEEWLKFYEENAPKGLTFTNLKTLFGAVMTTRKAVISNDPANDPRSGGLPSGHPPLKAFLGMPFFRADLMVGMIGIANRPGGYDEKLVLYLQPFLNTCATLVEAVRADQSRSRAEETLKASEKRYRHLLESASDIIYETDERGRFKFFNSAALRITGYSEEELLQFDFLTLAHPKFREEIKQFYEEQFSKRISSTYWEFPIISKAEEQIWLGQHVRLISEGKQVTGFHAVARNITARKKAEEALQKSEARLQAILNTAVDSIITINESGIIEDYNRAAESMFGYQSSEVVGRNVNMLMPSPYREKHDAFIANYCRTGKRRVIGTVREVTALRKDGSTFPADLSLSEVRTPSDRLFTGILRDITDRKATQAKLDQMLKEIEKTRDDLLEIMHMLDLGIIVIQEEKKVVFVNTCARGFLGKRAEALIGKPWNDALGLNHEDKLKLEQSLQTPSKLRQAMNVRIDLDDGRLRWIDIKIQDDPRAHGRKILVFSDMTEVYELRQLIEERSRFYNLVGQSGVMQEVYEQIQQLSTVDWTVLIEGETGTGKELVARAIHMSSHRKDGPFVAVNCAGLSDTLLVSQLFGHKKGAFTGAVDEQKGFFEESNGGTLFLDEIGDISQSIQTSLLRVLEEKQIMRLGESKPRKVDVRIISATNRNLGQEAESGRFRLDLLYRLRVGRIKLPALRERREDIPLLCQEFLEQSRIDTKKSVGKVSSEALQMLLEYPWPGNVRELKSAVDYATLHCMGAVIEPKDLPPEIKSPKVVQKAATMPDPVQDEAQSILEALKRARGNRTKAARILGISRATLYRRLDEMGIPPK